MSILCSCVLAMSHLSRLEALHYTLSPTDIVIDDHGVCKVLCPALSDHLFDFNFSSHFYYAPETLRIFKMQTAPNGLTNKSGVFTLGMTLLHMLLLTPLTHLYDPLTYTLDYEELNDLLLRVKSADLREVLKKMLKQHSYDRITFTELEEMLFEVISRAEQSGQSSQTNF
jgi:serine/threonine protein kinase